MANSFISDLQLKRCNYNHPDQATSQANSLILLSSGIYTEEERFVFELLQNAVDAHNDAEGTLDIKILINKEYFVFLHNGEAFSTRDIEGICDVGNGNKMKDIKKIGYKGIGFKSVFMRSTDVTVLSGSYCFRFAKSHWDKYWDEHWDKSYGEKDSEKEYLMPWQIIPIEAKPPIQVNLEGCNVATYIKVADTKSLEIKVCKLLSSSQFLLFLKSRKIKMSLTCNGSKICEIEKTQNGNLVVLSSNGVEESRWLIHTNEYVEVPLSLMPAINADINTPTKLKDAKTFDLSFAIALDEKGKLKRLEKAVVYTYLPTSFCFGGEGFPFLVNANFITDAGRQQLHKDSEWNKLIFSKIPSEFLNWMKELSSNYDNYWEVLPEKSYGSTNVLEEIYTIEMEKAIKIIAFIPRLSDPSTKVLASDAVMDRMGISEAISQGVLVNHINRNYNTSFFNYDFIKNIWKGSKILGNYGVYIFDKQKLKALFDDKKAFEGITPDLDAKLINFLFCYYMQNKSEREELINILQSTKFILDENTNLQMPGDLFFPSDYKEQNDYTEDAHMLHMVLLESIDAQVKNWLMQMGVEVLSDISFIKNVICKDDYINKENAIEVAHFLFNTYKKEDLIGKVGLYNLSKLKFLTKKGNLKKISELYLGHEFNPSFDIESQYDGDIFVSEQYANKTSLDLWASFFLQIGVCAEFSLTCMEKDYEHLTSIERVFLGNAKSEVEECTFPYQGYTNKFHLDYFGIYYFPIIDIVNTPYALSKIIWSYVLAKECPDFTDDFAYGYTGMSWFKRSLPLKKHTHIDENYAIWVLREEQTFPASDGSLQKAKNLLLNTEDIRTLGDKYLSIINVDCEIHESWNSLLMFQNSIKFKDCLEILTNISQDPKNASTNKERISKIYQRLIELDALSANNKEKIRKWASGNKLLSRDNVFMPPKELSHITLEGFSAKNRVHIGNPSSREKVIELLSLMGVRIITEQSVKTNFQSASEDNCLKKILYSKSQAIALVAVGEGAQEESFKQKHEAIRSLISTTKFFHCERIELSYGNEYDKIKKQTFGNKNEFYYTGDLRPANVEPLLTPLCKFLGIKEKERELFIMLIENMDGVCQNLKEKGYDISLIKDVHNEPEGNINVGLDYHPDFSQQTRNTIVGFKGEIIIYEKLRDLGYDPICPSISTEQDYDYKVFVNNKTYFCKKNNNKYDITFSNENGHTIYVEVKSTTTSVGQLENMPISSREWSMIKECDKENDRSYIIARVFGIDSSEQEIYLLKGHILDN